MGLLTIVDIIEEDFGCEGRPAGQEPRVTVVAADAAGRELRFVMADRLAYDRGLDLGDQVLPDLNGGLVKAPEANAMTERDKALAGLEFIRGDPELKRRRDRAEQLCYELNTTPPQDAARKQELLRRLLPHAKGEFCVKSPFLCEYGDFITLGNNFFANYNCKLVDGGQISFGDDVLVGPDCTFVTAVHPTDPERRRAGYQIFRPISVGSNVWFGTGVVVCPGVTIGDNCVIGAGSVVVKDIPANSVAAGSPCRVIRKVNE